MESKRLKAMAKRSAKLALLVYPPRSRTLDRCFRPDPSADSRNDPCRRVYGSFRARVPNTCRVEWRSFRQTATSGRLRFKMLMTGPYECTIHRNCSNLFVHDSSQLVPARLNNRFTNKNASTRRTNE